MIVACIRGFGKGWYDEGMIGRIRGILERINENQALVDVGGVGYLVSLTGEASRAVSACIGEEVAIETYLAVREQALDLYGFASERERDFFILLITVSGIGPKSALSILTIAEADTIAGAVRAGESAYLTKVSGIGKKNAEKIVLELKDKLGALEEEGGTISLKSESEALEALRALGYSQREAREALSAIEKEHTTTDARIKAALRLLGS